VIIQSVIGPVSFLCGAVSSDVVRDLDGNHKRLGLSGKRKKAGVNIVMATTKRIGGFGLEKRKRALSEKTGEPEIVRNTIDEGQIWTLMNGIRLLKAQAIAPRITMTYLADGRQRYRYQGVECARAYDMLRADDESKQGSISKIHFWFVARVAAECREEKLARARGFLSAMRAIA
jgi:hypothetical protein